MSKQPTSGEFWAAEEKRLSEKFAVTGDVCDKIEAKACRTMQDPTFSGGFEFAFDRAIRTTNFNGK